MEDRRIDARAGFRRDGAGGGMRAGDLGGAGSTDRATAEALRRAADARSIVLVEGLSDQIAVETLAHRLGHDLARAGVVVVPIGGAQAIGRFLRRFGPDGADVWLSGLCDAAEEPYVRRALHEAGFGPMSCRQDLEVRGFFVCVDDLEDELIRAVGRRTIEALLDSEGDRGSFRTMQKQPAWRHADFDAQLRRFLGAGARRKLRYARSLVDSVDGERVPRPLRATLEHALDLV